MIVKGLEADATVGFTRARYDEYTDASSGASYNGNNMIMSPDYTARVGLQYRHDSGMFVRGDVNHIGPFYWDGSNQHKRSSVTTLDARIGWESASFDVHLFGKNILDERYLSYYSAPNNLSFVGETATYGVEMAYRF
jgi:iron complex outermembrane receptor protein